VFMITSSTFPTVAGVTWNVNRHTFEWPWSETNERFMKSKYINYFAVKRTYINSCDMEVGAPGSQCKFTGSTTSQQQSINCAWHTSGRCQLLFLSAVKCDVADRLRNYEVASAYFNIQSNSVITTSVYATPHLWRQIFCCTK